MKFQVTSRLELNLFKVRTNTEFVTNFAIKNRIPAIVTAPENLAALLAYREARRGQFKVICALDFPRGNNFAMDKIYRSDADFVAADGFEVLLSRNRTGVELRNEMKAIYEFLKMNVPHGEIRWCIGMSGRSEEEISSILGSMSTFPPSFVRTDQDLVLPESVGPNEHSTRVDMVRSKVPFPIKVSGNINWETFKALKDNKFIKRFDVSVEQAESLLREIDQEMRGVQNALTLSDHSRIGSETNPTV